MREERGREGDEGQRDRKRKTETDGIHAGDADLTPSTSVIYNYYYYLQQENRRANVESVNWSCFIRMDQSQCFNIQNHTNLLLKEQQLNETSDGPFIIVYVALFLIVYFFHH